MQSVWIEWFLFDNFLMGFLILKCAEAFSRKKLHSLMTVLVCAGSAVLSAFAMTRPYLLSPPVKALLFGWMTAAFLPRNLEEALGCGGCVLLGTCLLGGAAYGLCGLFAGRFSGGVLYADATVRALLSTTAMGVLLPRWIRRLLAARRLEKRDVNIQITTEFGTAKLLGRIDTGNSLAEPLSGLPVVVVDSRAAGGVLPAVWKASWREAPIKGMLLVPYRTVDGAGVMAAVRGRLKAENGEEKECCVALSYQMLKDCEAVINAQLFV